jgi:hypothetical protein
MEFTPWELDVIARDCSFCGRMMHVCDHRERRLHTLDGPVELICKLNHCPDPTFRTSRLRYLRISLRSASEQG